MNLVVVGDCLLDVDLVGSVSRICPDAPAPVLDENTRSPRPGGAGLAAWLAARTGEPVTLVTALRDDQDGTELRAELAEVPVVAGPSGAPTPVKTRVRAGTHTLARIDRGGGGSPVVTAEMLATVRRADAILVSDYGRGLAAQAELREALTEMARRIPVVWDPHPKGAPPVPGVTVVTPNLGEALAFSGAGGAREAAERLRSRWHAAAVAVTLGERGALLVDDGEEPTVLPATPVSGGDTCGAGDRFAVALAGRLMRHDSLSCAVAHAVTAAAEFVAAGGAGGLANFGQQPRTDRTGLASARALIADVRSRNGTVVATGGCFDVLHAGHVRTLRAARSLGDCLVVCLNSDDSVRALKGPSRPLNRQDDRVEVLSALDCVDRVVVFDGSGPGELLVQLRPDVWVKGGDYTPESLPETGLVRGWGGAVVVVPYHDGRSTTRLAELMKGEANV